MVLASISMTRWLWLGALCLRPTARLEAVKLQGLIISELVHDLWGPSEGVFLSITYVFICFGDIT